MCLPPPRGFHRSAASVVTLGVVAAAAVGCSELVGGQAVVDRLDPGQPIVWGPCDVDGSTDADPASAMDLPPGAQCGRIGVPVNWDDPDGESLELALVKIPATGEKVGSLIVNPGGPGESGVNFALYKVTDLPDEIRERYDVVSFDPRGVAASSPAVRCNTDEQDDQLRADPMVDYSEAGVQRINDETRAFVQRCVDKMGEEFLANIGTVSVAKDLDAIRAAVGDEKLTYLGYSYGTRIGSSYIELFPENVGRMILDGAIDPNADRVESNIEQNRAFQEAFNDYAADCALDTDCPLGQDPAKAVDVFKSLVDPLVDRPAATEDPRNLAYGDAVGGTLISMYSPTYWEYLTQGLRELTVGRGDTLLALSDILYQRDADGVYSNALDSRVAVNCVDEEPITDPAVAVEQDRRIREVAPFLSYGEFTGYAPMDTCAFWPAPPTSEPHEISVSNLAPTLVVSVTGDPATPYQAGVELANQLGGGLVTFEGTQHTVVFSGDECVDAFAVGYLIDGTLPPRGARC